MIILGFELIQNCLGIGWRRWFSLSGRYCDKDHYSRNSG
ncbi:hypothetical protein I543_0062 [Mycobacteroides abscessus 21]|uniref:Uncharacterized protein n=1 Tax=Mycobacteroides abscessus 21 TaxID=1299324 RepID=A0A829Q1U0_9MYCO|nr:hypothetical protein I543_0062 [Mycobacteroides abscessus 21]SLG89008.1 Uncharacterised protein [Mycobacteroides abscessus subsp. abscessus]